MILLVKNWVSIFVWTWILSLQPTLGQMTAGSHPMLASLFNVVNNVQQVDQHGQQVDQHGQQGSAQVQPLRPHFNTPRPDPVYPLGNQQPAIPGFQHTAPKGPMHKEVFTGIDTKGPQVIQQHRTWSQVPIPPDTQRPQVISQHRTWPQVPIPKETQRRQVISQQGTWSQVPIPPETPKTVGVPHSKLGGLQVGKLPDNKDTSGESIIAATASMMCSYCRQTKNTTCIKIWCMNTGGFKPSSSGNVFIESNTNVLRQPISTGPVDSNVNAQGLDPANSIGFMDAVRKHPLLAAGFSIPGQHQPNIAVLPSLGNDQFGSNTGPISGAPAFHESGVRGPKSVDILPANLAPITSNNENIHNQGSVIGFEKNPIPANFEPISSIHNQGQVFGPEPPRQDTPLFQVPTNNDNFRNQGNEIGVGTQFDPVPASPNTDSGGLPLGPIELGSTFGVGSQFEPVPASTNTDSGGLPLGPVELGPTSFENQPDVLGPIDLPSPNGPEIRQVPQANNVFEHDAAAKNQLFEALQNDINVFDTAAVGVGTPNTATNAGMSPPVQTPIVSGSHSGIASNPDGAVISTQGRPIEIPMNSVNDITNINFHESFGRLMALPNERLWDRMQEFDLNPVNNVNSQPVSGVNQWPVDTGPAVASGGAAVMQTGQGVAQGGPLPSDVQQFPAGFVEEFPTISTIPPLRKAELSNLSASLLRGLGRINNRG